MVINDKTVARFVTVAMDSGLPSQINLVILDGAHDFRSIFNTGPGRNWRASPFGATSSREQMQRTAVLFDHLVGARAASAARRSQTPLQF